MMLFSFGTVCEPSVQCIFLCCVVMTRNELWFVLGQRANSATSFLLAVCLSISRNTTNKLEAITTTQCLSCARDASLGYVVSLCVCLTLERATYMQMNRLLVRFQAMHGSVMYRLEKKGILDQLVHCP